MWQQILHIWVITYVSATGIEHEHLSLINLKDILQPKIDILGMVISGLSKNSTENQFEDEAASLQFLKRKVVDNLHHPESYLCSNPYEVACDWYWIKSRRPTEWDLVLGPLKNQLLLLKNEVKNLLAKPVLKTDSKSLIIEKQLYQDCLTLLEKPSILKSQSITDYALSTIIDNATHKSWQKIDKELGSLGFGYTFFNIAVTENYQTKKKMLVLEPPSSIELVDSFEALSKVMNELKLHSNHKKEFQLAMHFFTALNKANPEKSTTDTMTVPEWYDYYLQGNGGQGTQSSEIYWHEIFHSFAQHRGVHTEYIIVKNKEYFQELERLLRLFSETGNHIGSFVAIKWTINNLNYVNLNAYSQLHSLDKNSTCVQQIKLYGASQVVLQSLEESTDIKYLLDTAKTILYYIVKTIAIDIFISQNLRETEKIMLKSYLYDITAPIMHNQTYFSDVDNFYGDFKVTHHYFKDIINYRQSVHIAESRVIDNYGSPEKLPFNINDLSKPQNRLRMFVLRAYLRMQLLVSPYLHKEYHYGVYGTDMSRFIYDLIISKALGLKEKRENDEEWVYTKIQYPSKLKTCLVGKVPVDEMDTVISEVMALKTAYESMKQNYLHDEEIRRPFVFNDGVRYSEDAMFILPYLKDHCFWRGDLGSHVLQNFQPSFSAFGCEFGYPRCNIEIF